MEQESLILMRSSLSMFSFMGHAFFSVSSLRTLPSYISVSKKCSAMLKGK